MVSMVTYLWGIVTMETAFYLNTVGSKQRGAWDKHLGCVLSYAKDNTGELAADLMMQYHKRISSFPGKKKKSWKKNNLTKTTNTHTFKITTVVYSHEPTQNVCWSF